MANYNNTIPSLAGTEKTYALAQIRPRAKNRINLQIQGPKGNRSYGFAVELSVPETLVNYLKSLSTVETVIKTVEVSQETPVFGGLSF